jgi:hypothetical protein
LTHFCHQTSLLLILLQPLYTHRRYDFYKSRVPNFSSSDPRKVVDPEEPIEETQCLLFNKKPYGSKTLAYDDDDDQDEEVQAGKKVVIEESFRDLEKFGRKSSRRLTPKPLWQQILEEEPSKEVKQMESEQLVEWDNVDDLASFAPRRADQSMKVGESSRKLPESKLVFAFTGITDNVGFNLLGFDVEVESSARDENAQPMEHEPVKLKELNVVLRKIEIEPQMEEFPLEFILNEENDDTSVEEPTADTTKTFQNLRFKCQVEGCEKSFAHESSRDRHQISHSGDFQ